MDESDLVLIEIGIKKWVDSDGVECWATSFKDREGHLPGLLECLSLLEAAKIDLMQRSGMIPMPPDQEDAYE